MTSGLDIAKLCIVVDCSIVAVVMLKMLFETLFQGTPWAWDTWKTSIFGLPYKQITSPIPQHPFSDVFTKQAPPSQMHKVVFLVFVSKTLHQYLAAARCFAVQRVSCVRGKLWPNDTIAIQKFHSVRYWLNLSIHHFLCNLAVSGFGNAQPRNAISDFHFEN